MIASSPNSFRQRLRRRERLLGTLVTLPLPQIAEILSQAGFDWLFVDGEHAPLAAAEIEGLIRAAGPACACVVRVPDLEVRSIKSALDSGAAGIIAPLVNTAEQADAVVQAAKYPPDGRRSVGIGRAHGYGVRFQTYLASANLNTAVIVQVEHIEAVGNIAEIVAVPGVDCVFLGPYDLSGSLGKPGQLDDPEVQNAILEVEHVCRHADMPLGIFGLEPDSLVGYAERGFSLLALGLDSLFLAQAASSARERLTNATDPVR